MNSEELFEKQNFIEESKKVLRRYRTELNKVKYTITLVNAYN
jgi:hypothetical protein